MMEVFKKWFCVLAVFPWMASVAYSEIAWWVALPLVAISAWEICYAIAKCFLRV